MSTSFLNRHHFLLRRLHSLTGIVPIGVFLINHLLTNSSLLWGKYGLREEGAGMGIQDGGVAYFQKEVSWINEQIPHLLLIEISLWAAIAFHIVLGVIYAKTGSSNTNRYPYQGNWRYKLQRLSGYVGVLFIFYHIATLRWGWTFLMPHGKPWDAKFAASTLNEALTAGGLGWDLGLAALYVIGVSLLVFHFANGLWTAAITWGLTVSAKAQERWGYVCAGFGTALMLMAWASILGAMTLDASKAAEVEKKHSIVTPNRGWAKLPLGEWRQEPRREHRYEVAPMMTASPLSGNTGASPAPLH